MQAPIHSIFNNLQSSRTEKPLGDDEDFQNEESTAQIGQNNSYNMKKKSIKEAKNKQNPTQQQGDNNENKNEYKIAKELLGIYEDNSNENKRKFKIDQQFLKPIFIFSDRSNQQTNLMNQVPSSVYGEQTQAKQDNSQINNNQGLNYSPFKEMNKDNQITEEGIDKIGIQDRQKSNISSHLITLNPLISNNQIEVKIGGVSATNSKQEEGKEDNTERDGEEDEFKIKKMLSTIPNQSPQIQPGQIEELAFNNGLILGTYQHPNMEIVEQMCEKELTDIKVVGSIYIMLVSILTQLNMLQLAQKVYIKFQKEIMQVEEGSQMFDVDLYGFIDANLNSTIYLNEMIILSLRVQEFIPLLNIFLIIFQIRIQKIRKQIVSAMSKKSLNSLEILIANYKKRMPKKKSKRIQGNSKIRKAMDLITSFYMKKGSIENEHELIMFMINEGFQQISVELLMYFIYSKFIPPELFITKKVIKASLIELNIPIFAKAFQLRSKWVKSLFLQEKFFLHICQLIRCNETFAEGLYFLKKISQKKQRSSAPLWYTETVIEILEEVAQKQVQYQMLQIYTLNPLITAIIISKMLFKLSLNKNPLQVQLNRLSEYFKNLAIEFRDQITDERQMKMTLFKIVFPSDKPLVTICKTDAIYTYFNEFLQSELILKLLAQKYESSQYFDMNLLASSTSFNYLFNFKKLKTPYLHYNQKFEKIEEQQQSELQQKQTSVPIISFNISENTEKDKGDKQFFGHILQQQQSKPHVPSLFKFKAMSNQKIQSNQPNLVKQYRAAIKKKKTILFNNEQTSVKYQNENKSEKDINNNQKGSTLNVFKEITPASFRFVSKINHFYQYSIYKKSLQLRSYLEMILYFAIFIFCLTTFFPILNLTNAFLSYDTDFLNLMFGCPTDSLKAEIAIAYQTYVPQYTIDQIRALEVGEVEVFCTRIIDFLTGGITKYQNEWLDDCIGFVAKNSNVQTVLQNFNSSIYFVYLIPAGYILKEIHSKIVKKRYKYDITEYIDMLLVYLCIQHYFTNEKVMAYSQNQCTYPLAQDMVNDLQTFIYVLTGILFCLFAKVFQFLSRTEKLGIFVKILYLTFKQVFAVLFLFALNILAFASLLFLLSSYRLDIYDSLPNSIRTLIATSLGTFDYKNMNLAESIIQTVFLFAANVIMINLLIAILTKTYSQTTERGNVEYALILFDEFIIGKFDSNYSLLIAFPPPLNMFQLLFFWVLFFQKLRDLNNVFQKLFYTVLLIVVYAIFLALNLVIVPFSWLKMIFSIIHHQYKSINLNVILHQRKDKNNKTSVTDRAYCTFIEWLVLIFKLMQWLILGLPYLLFHAIITDSYTFFKSAYTCVDNKYQYSPNLLNTPLPQRSYYLIKCQPQLIDYRFKSDSIIQNFHLVQNYLKFKFFIELAQKELAESKKGTVKVIKNYFLKVLKLTIRRKNQMKQFHTKFDSEYQKIKDKQNDLIQNEHTDPSFLAIMRTKQIYYSTEYWQKNKVTTSRQMKFYNLVINPSIKHNLQVQQSLIRKVQSQSQNISHIRNIQKQVSSAAQIPQQSSHNSLNKHQPMFHKQQTQRKKLQTLYEQIDVE